MQDVKRSTLTHSATSRFWDRWLFLATIGLILFGADFIVLPDVMHSIYSLLLYGTQDTGFSAEAMRYLYFAYGVLGAVTIGWGLTILYTLRGGFARRVPESWQAVAISIIVWFVIDSGFSIVSGFAANAALNAAFFALFMIPLLAVRGEFFGEALK